MRDRLRQWLRRRELALRDSARRCTSDQRRGATGKRRVTDRSLAVSGCVPSVVDDVDGLGPVEVVGFSHDRFMRITEDDKRDEWKR